MDYKKQYDLLIEKSRTRTLEIDTYRERHHVIPRCLGGSDEPENIVELTPEEHYVAHQLLVKMHPGHNGLIWAALQMTGHSSTEKRSNNKLYGWLRRKYQKIAKQRLGDKNGSFGTHWYHHPKTLHRIKRKPEHVPEGYIKGRSPNNKCKSCGKDTGNRRRKYCKIHRDKLKKQQARENLRESRKKCKVSDKEIESALYNNDMNKTEALKSIGLIVTGFNWKRITKISEKMIENDPNLEKKHEAWINLAKKNKANLGKSWYHNPKTKHSILCYPKNVPSNYVKGRTITGKN